MASTDLQKGAEPDVDWPDTYRRTQTKLASSVRTRLKANSKDLFWQAVRNLVTWELPEEQAEIRDLVHTVWDDCVERRVPDLPEQFRQEIERSPYSRMYAHSGQKERLHDLVLGPARTGVWKLFVEKAAMQEAVVIIFGVCRWTSPWLLSNDETLNHKLKRPLCTHLEVASRMSAPNVLFMPLLSLEKYHV